MQLREREELIKVRASAHSEDSKLEPCSRSMADAFTLIELLAVMAIVGMLLTLSVPVLDLVTGAGSENSALVTLEGTLVKARSEAMAGNRWVWVAVEPGEEGIELTTYGSRDGTAELASADEVIALGTPSRLVNMALDPDLPPLSSAPRPPADPVLPEVGGWVVFSPGGEARLALDTALEIPPNPSSNLNRWIEIGFIGEDRKAGGVALQIAGSTGQIRIYRPGQ